MMNRSSILAKVAVLAVLAFTALAAVHMTSQNKNGEKPATFLRGEQRDLQKVLTAKDFQFGGPLAPYIIQLPENFNSRPTVLTAKDFQFGGPLAPSIIQLPENFNDRPTILTAKDFQPGGPLAPTIIQNSNP